MESPYLRNFVVARVNPIRFLKGKTMPIDEALEKMEQAATKFKTDKISVADLARSGACGRSRGKTEENDETGETRMTKSE